MDHQQIIEASLAALRQELAEHGDRVIMFVPYIPLMVCDATGAHPDYSCTSEAEIDRINASREAVAERSVKVSDMIRTLNGLLRIMHGLK